MVRLKDRLFGTSHLLRNWEREFPLESETDFWTSSRSDHSSNAQNTNKLFSTHPYVSQNHNNRNVSTLPFSNRLNIFNQSQQNQTWLNFQHQPFSNSLRPNFKQQRFPDNRTIFNPQQNVWKPIGQIRQTTPTHTSVSTRNGAAF